MGYTHFDDIKRMELSILRRKGYSCRDIANALGVHHTSVARELRRNSARSGSYDPSKADHKAYCRRKYSKYQGMKIRELAGMEEYVKARLNEDRWTPEEISGRLEDLNGEQIIGVRTIYRWLDSVYGQQYRKYLPYHKKKPGRKKNKEAKNSHIPNRVSIEQRPEEINERKRIGDFEGDTMGKPKGCPETLVAIVDRKSRFLMARKVTRLKHAMEDGFQVMLKGIKAQSLTLDNGFENVRHESLGIPTYFCHAYSSWEKGTIENTFQRLRRYIPKKARLEDFSEETIAFIVKRMNNTPRKCLNFRTPAEVFKEQAIP